MQICIPPASIQKEYGMGGLGAGLPAAGGEPAKQRVFGGLNPKCIKVSVFSARAGQRGAPSASASGISARAARA